ncbi:MAG: CRISPR-associated endoribonuclease Cas6 [Phaeodactylibacter sp.]|nr:CRISPR-associated endoribonuclease Cas6 [Phaeodactylibacter sp.]
MRIKLLLTPNLSIVPFDYQHHVIGVFHRWMGSNHLHDVTSLYSLGWLSHGRVVKDAGFVFAKGATWEVSFFDDKLATHFIGRVNADQQFIFGMRVHKMEVIPTPSFSSTYRFGFNSPILVRRDMENGKKEHLSFEQGEADELLTQTFRYKMQLAGFKGEHLDSWMGFDRSYSKARTKVVTIKNIKLKANQCPVIVMGTPEAVQFAWEVGAGHLTGSCFGQLKTA